MNYFLISGPTDKLFVIFAINILSYLLALALILSILVLINGHNFRSLTNIAKLGSIDFTRFAFLIALLSLSGMPPFLGFFAKFFIFFNLMLKGNYIFILIFVLFNLGSLYFYLQNIRQLTNSRKRKAFKTIAGRAYLPGGWGTLLLSLVVSLTFAFLALEIVVILLSCQIN